MIADLQSATVKSTVLHVRGRQRAPNGLSVVERDAPPGAPRVAIYSRTSTARQPIDSQHQACLDYCQRREYAIVREYLEEDNTGDSPYLGPLSLTLWSTLQARPLFRLLLIETMLYRPFDRVVCWSLDRWARLRGPDGLAIRDALQRHGVRLEFVWPEPGMLDVVEQGEDGEPRAAGQPDNGRGVRRGES